MVIFAKAASKEQSARALMGVKMSDSVKRTSELQWAVFRAERQVRGVNSPRVGTCCSDVVCVYAHVCLHETDQGGGKGACCASVHVRMYAYISMLRAEGRAAFALHCVFSWGMHARTCANGSELWRESL